jgi:hypothetical protein
MKHDQEFYIAFDPFETDETPVRMRSQRFVTTRRPQKCCGIDKGMHTLAPGSQTRYETALIEESFWGRYYLCTDCIDSFLERFPIFLPEVIK